MVPLFIASLGSKEADIGSHNFYGFGHFSNVSCHVLVLPRTARLSVLKENGFRCSEVQEKRVLQSMLNRGNSSCMQSGFWFLVVFVFFFLVAGMISGPSTLVNCMKNKTYRNVYIRFFQNH